MEDDDRVKFETRIRKHGNSHYLLIPPAVRKHLDLNHKDKIEMQAEKGNKGKYASFWKQENEPSD